MGGFNVYPAEVENGLVSHPKVALAAVIGVADEKGGEKVKAFIQLKPGETATQEEILGYSRDTLAAYKRPKEIEFREKIPTSGAGRDLQSGAGRDLQSGAGRDLQSRPQHFALPPASERSGRDLQSRPAP